MTSLKNQTIITAYGVGRGNAPARVVRVGHLRAVFHFLTNYNYVTHLKGSQICDNYGRTII